MPRTAPVRARRLDPGTTVTILTTVAATAASLVAVVSPASAVPEATTSCDAAAAGFTPVLQLDLPERASFLNETPPYSLDRTAEIGSNFDRIGYCLELNGPDGPQWVWTAMEPFTNDARRIGLPTRPGELVRQRVGDLEVRSNVPGVTSGTGQTGYLEMWPNQYQESASTQVANASPITFDVDDNPTSPLGYGSFQVSPDRPDPAVEPRGQAGVRRSTPSPSRTTACSRSASAPTPAASRTGPSRTTRTVTHNAN